MYNVKCIIALRKGAIIYYTFYMKKKYILSSRMAIIHSTLYIKTIITHGFIYKDKAHSPYSPVSY